jgi:hypothetical protein
MEEEQIRLLQTRAARSTDQMEEEKALLLRQLTEMDDMMQVPSAFSLRSVVHFLASLRHSVFVACLLGLIYSVGFSST